MNNIVVLLATYNGSEVLQEQVNSLLDQSLDIDILIRDDGSKDDSLNIIKRYESENENIKFLKDNQSSNSAKENFSILLEYALSLEKYEYFMFCDQDDIWKRNKVLKTLTKLKEQETLEQDIPILVHTNLEVVDENLNLLSRSYWNYQKIDPSKDGLNTLLVQNIITGNTMMLNKKCAKLSSKIPKDVIMHDWWIGMVTSSFGKIIYLKEPTILYRQHSANDTGASKFGFMSIVKKLLKFTNINTQKYLLQGKLFFEIYKDQLDEEKKELLEEFINIRAYPFYKRWYTLYKYKILKNKLTRNIGLFIKI